VKLTLSPEQTQLKDSVARFVATHGAKGELTGEALQKVDFRPDLWRQMAELGWLGAGLSEAEGGYGGGAVETAVILEEAGRGLLPEPLLAATTAIRLLAEAQPAGALLEAAVAGDELLVAAADDAGSGSEPGLRLSTANSQVVLTGTTPHLNAAEHATRLLLPCASEDGIAIVSVQKDAPGVTLDGYRTLDGRRAANITFADVAVEDGAVLARGAQAEAALQAARDLTVAMLCAEATGVASFLFDETLAYLKTRRQFGQVIGRFQALQHRMADMFVALEEARSLSLMATVALADADPKARARALSAAKIGAVARAMHVAREAIQLHGGVGMTQELPIGAGFRRIKTLELSFGSEHHHLDRLAALEMAAA
jgi:alkylation response protein AidB-like acyl-CoA dehydrogenase